MQPLLPPLRPLASLEQPAFEQLLHSAAAAAAGRASSPSPSPLSLDAALWPTREALVGFFLECTRSGTSSEELRSSLATILSAERAEQVAQLFAEAQQPFCRALEGCGIGFPELVDVRWSRSSLASASMRDARAVGSSL
ncbi:MAG: hypothetical protein SGPRY_008705, partial [Prymnesium sp.]